MADSNLQRFQCRSALTAYLRHRFGVQDIHSPHSVRELTNALNTLREGYDDEGRVSVRFISHSHYIPYQQQ
jgi:hypothetical protein